MVTDIIDGDPVLDCRFWAASNRAAATVARDAAITAVLARLVADGVPTPTPEHRVIMVADAAPSPPKTEPATADELTS